MALGTRLGGAISKNSEILLKWGCFFYHDEKFDNTSSKEILENINFFKNLQNWEKSWKIYSFIYLFALYL